MQAARRCKIDILSTIRCICACIYIYIYLVRHGNRQDIFYGFRRRHHPTFSICSFIFMVSVVFSLFSFLWFIWFPSWQETISYGLRRWFSFLYGFRRGRKMFFFVLMVSFAGLLVDSAAARGFIILECIERFLVSFCVFRTGFRRCFFVFIFLNWFPSWQENVFLSFLFHFLIFS